MPAQHVGAAQPLRKAAAGRRAGSSTMRCCFARVQETSDGRSSVKLLSQCAALCCIRAVLCPFDACTACAVCCVQVGEKFNLMLARTIYTDGTPETGKYDEVRRRPSSSSSTQQGQQQQAEAGVAGSNSTRGSSSQRQRSVEAAGQRWCQASERPAAV